MLTKKAINDLIFKVNGAAIEVHRELGSGLLEKVYHKCLTVELTNRGIGFETEKVIPILYKGENVNADLYLDLYIEGILPVELKATDKLNDLFVAQLLTYMKLLKAPKGILINFNVPNLMQNGQKAFVLEQWKFLPDQ
jgi:GxxExxY protein